MTKVKKVRLKTHCPKCGGVEFEIQEMYVTGSRMARLFDIQNRKFNAVSCAKCGFTELYKLNTSKGLDILDFLVGR
ncbi:MAG: zinc ribbon domain-containing protein [Bacteroidales bacterium]|nr:zinc ribbon domain-containing protein [Bacteroidales bacterium]